MDERAVGVPRFPIYIPSKGRADSRITMRYLDAMSVPYRVVVEEQERDAYAAHIDPSRLLVLDPLYKARYELCDELGTSISTGSGPARNFIWDHALAEGHAWHWVVDDNIRGFCRLNRNRRIVVRDGAIFAAMEDFCLRYRNVSMAGPNYRAFVPANAPRPPLKLNTRIYSCNLIRTDVPYRWRGRYNEDTELSLRMLKDGWCTVLFNTFLQQKAKTLSVKGGNTTELYASQGTLPKSEMLRRLHPDVTRVVWKYNRWHHYVDYWPFAKNVLVPRPDVSLPTGVNEFGMRLVPVQRGRMSNGG